MALNSLSQIDPLRPIHLSGVAGSAMNGLALMLRQRGFKVVGTDPRAESVRERLEAAGVKVYQEQDGTRIPEDAALLVISQALPPDHPELVTARARGIEMVTYPQFLGAIMADREGIAVAGTHGKTTVTAMVVHALRAVGISPGFVIGGDLPSLGRGADMGDSPIFVAEACEYKRSFMSLCPRIAVITCIERDHLDVYDGIEDIKHAFSTFAAGLPLSNGVLVHSAACAHTASIIGALKVRKISFGLECKADVSAHGIIAAPEQTTFEVRMGDGCILPARLKVPGRHNVANALAAMAVCGELDVNLEQIVRSFADFEGVRRRFDIRGETAGITVVDDYAHHPTELRVLLDAAAERFPNRRRIIAFQPHQYSRTRLLLRDFADALSFADKVLIPDIYEARDSEEDKISVNSKMLVEEIRRRGTDADYSGNLGSLRAHLLEIAGAGDVIITAGAGDIDGMADSIVEMLKARC